MRVAPIIATLLTAAALAGAAEPGIPGLDPIPHASPLVPLPDNPAELTPEQRLQRMLDQQIRDADRKIEALRAKYGDLPQTVPTVSGTSLEAPRKERDQAWSDLQHSLHAFDDHAASTKKDVLDSGRPVAQAAQIGPLSVVNQLRIASCYQELVSAGNSTASDLHDAQEVLDKIDQGDLPESERPRFHYLRVWFYAEQARRAEGEDRLKFINSANGALQALQQLHSDSELNTTARALLIGLDAPAKEKAKEQTQ